MSGQGSFEAQPGGPPGTGPHRSPGAIQPVRAVLVLLVAALVAVVVLARLGGAGATITPITPASKVTTTTTTAPVASAASTTTTANVVGTSTTTTTIAPSHVLVLVLNGWTTRHAALYFKNRLAFFGYDLLVPVDAVSDTNQTSKIFYVHAQYEPTALAIAGELDLPASDVLAPSSGNDSALVTADLNSADVIVLVGEDISGRVPAGYNG